MAEDSTKEKLNADLEEKDQDTKNDDVPRSPPRSNAASAKSGAAPSSRQKSPKSPKSGRSEKSSKSKGSKSKGSAKKDNASSMGKFEVNPQLQAKIDNFTMPSELPEGAKSLFLSSKTQELFNLVGATTDKPVFVVNKADILQDTIKRAAVSDFSPIKKKIQDYPEEEIVIIADLDYKFGENFVIILSIEAKDLLLVAPEVKHVEEEEIETETVVYKYVPPVSKPWISKGSEMEIEEESLKYRRPLLSQTIVRLRKNFGAPVVFKDRNVSDAKDAYIECSPYEDPSYDVSRIEKDTTTQAIPITNEEGTQTEWRYPKNANTQYHYREFNEKQQQEEFSKPKLATFMSEVRPRFDEALQQNEILNAFYDDWNSLADEDSSFGNKADGHLKEFQSFTDLLFSKDKTITCIDWHPGVKGLVAVSVAQKMPFDARVDNSHKIIMTPSLILIWSFVDPIHPLLLLEAPDDIYTFRFCPTEPNHVAGGCVNGQVVLWDLSAYAERLKNQRSNKQEKKKNTLNTLPGYTDENPMDTPIVRYAAVSSIENSHKAAITDLLWVPDHLELNRMGVPVENKSNQCVQIMTSAADHSILVWDTRPTLKAEMKKGSETATSGLGATFRQLDLVWKPLMKVHLHKSEPGGDHNPTVFSISEIQGDRSVLHKGSDELKESVNLDKGHFSTGISKPTSGKEKKTLLGVNTHMYCGTEDGDLVYVDWMPQKDQDSGKIQTPKPDYYHGMHDGRVICLQRSPFFKDMLLCVGGWTFTIWREGVSSGPIMRSPTSKRLLTGGFWSPSRPGVFYIARDDGSIDIWDLLEKTHEPSMNQNVSANPITCIYPYQVTHRQHLLAVGDNSGTLHVMEIPWSLRQQTSGEFQAVQSYLEREVARRNFVVSRWKFREEEKREIEAEHKKKIGIAPNIMLSEEEKDMRDKSDYHAFLEEEKNFLRQLGILKEEEENIRVA